MATMDMQPIQLVQPGSSQVGSPNKVEKDDTQASIFPSDSNKLPDDNKLPEEKEDGKGFFEKLGEGIKKTVDDVLVALGLKSKATPWEDLSKRKNDLNEQLREIQQQQLDNSKQLQDIMKEADEKAKALDEEIKAKQDEITETEKQIDTASQDIQPSYPRLV